MDILERELVMALVLSPNQIPFNETEIHILVNDILRAQENNREEVRSRIKEWDKTYNHKNK